MISSHPAGLHPQSREGGQVGSEVPGTVISFVTHPWDVSLVQKIELAVVQEEKPTRSSPPQVSLAPGNLITAGLNMMP